MIKPNDFGTFQTYNMRFFAALAATIVLFSFSDTFLANPLIAIGIGVLVFVVLQVKFNSFLKRCTVIANFVRKLIRQHSDRRNFRNTSSSLKGIAVSGLGRFDHL